MLLCPVILVTNGLPWGAFPIPVVFAVGVSPFLVPFFGPSSALSHHPLRLPRQLLLKPVSLCLTLLYLHASFWYLGLCISHVFCMNS